MHNCCAAACRQVHVMLTEPILLQVFFANSAVDSAHKHSVGLPHTGMSCLDIHWFAVWVQFIFSRKYMTAGIGTNQYRSVSDWQECLSDGPDIVQYPREMQQWSL